MHLEQSLRDFIKNNDTTNIDKLIEALSKYIVKIFGPNDKIGDIDDIKQEIYLFLSNKKEIFSQYSQNLEYIVKRSLINHFKDILRKKTISVIDKELDSETFETSLIKHPETEYITKIEFAQKLQKFLDYFSDKEKSLLVSIINNLPTNFSSKAAEYKAKERIKLKLKKVIFELNLDYQTADVILAYVSKNFKNIVIKEKEE